MGLHLILKTQKRLPILEVKMTPSLLRQPFSGDHLELICQLPPPAAPPPPTPGRLHLGINHVSPGSELAGWGCLLHVEGLARIFPQRGLKSYFIRGGEIGEKETNEKKNTSEKGEAETEGVRLDQASPISCALL